MWVTSSNLYIYIIIALTGMQVGTGSRCQSLQVRLLGWITIPIFWEGREVESIKQRFIPFHNFIISYHFILCHCRISTWFPTSFKSLLFCFPMVTYIMHISYIYIYITHTLCIYYLQHVCIKCNSIILSYVIIIYLCLYLYIYINIPIICIGLSGQHPFQPPGRSKVCPKGRLIGRWARMSCDNGWTALGPGPFARLMWPGLKHLTPPGWAVCWEHLFTKKNKWVF